MRQKKLLLLVLCCLVITAGCTHSTKTRETESDWTLRQEQAVTLADGTAVDLWESGGRLSYRLADGTELISVHRDSGPSNVYVPGREDLSWDTLPEEAQKNILAYYEQQGKVYDVEMELEKMYADYQNSQAEKTSFASGDIVQTISPTASNDKIIAYVTSVMLPAGQGRFEEQRLGAMFDKKTGEAITIWPLFDLPEEACRKQLITLAGITDDPLAAEMADALTAERIVWLDDGLQMTFSQAELASAETSYVLYVDYEDRRGVLQQGVVPDEPHRS